MKQLATLWFIGLLIILWIGFVGGNLYREDKTRSQMQSLKTTNIYLEDQVTKLYEALEIYYDDIELWVYQELAEGGEIK